MSVAALSGTDKYLRSICKHKIFLFLLSVIVLLYMMLNIYHIMTETLIQLGTGEI
ncbi:hypothetical protein CLOHYLEM_04076 [[Clostridium] hylemonae DSM 15053]|uniref:Uncharacterized protein n=1 Tax=[Clostridium] hylemonae DSM 15053 TaxID=553973 RepID=C0BW90_9FIRM|nr:hypothetical protein CLOHYLEM_04076 [[Clostridium] hylemonae DSM 15053]